MYSRIVVQFVYQIQNEFLCCIVHEAMFEPSHTHVGQAVQFVTQVNLAGRVIATLYDGVTWNYSGVGGQRLDAFFHVRAYTLGHCFPVYN